MFHRGFAFIGVTALLLGAGPARGGGDHHDDDGGDFEEQVQIKAALTLARAADANDNGAVTGGEWSAFVLSLDPGPDGVIAPEALLAALPLPPQAKSASSEGALASFVTLVYDHDGDGKIQTWDLAAFFAMLDTNADGSISVLEFAVAQGGLTTDQDLKALALLLALAADADKSGDVTGFEWGFFVASLDPDASGVIEPGALAAALGLDPQTKRGKKGPWWHHGHAGWKGDDEDDDEDDEDDDHDDWDDDHHHGPSSPEVNPLVLRLFDRDFDGRIGTDDLQALFALIDTDGNGALSPSEIAAAEGGPNQQLDDATRLALLLLRAADANDSGDVTQGEWSAFLASLNPDPNGVVDFLTLIAALPKTQQKAAQEDFDPVQSVQRLIKALDQDADGKVTTEDLNALFALIDTNGDGAASAAEIKSAGGALSQSAEDARRLATLLARAADADLSGDVTQIEWGAFLASLNPDANGVIDFLTLIAALPVTLAKSEPEPAEVVERLLKAFDRDGDGVVTTSDLNALFALLDTDADGALSSAELVPPKALRAARAPALPLLVRAADADHDRRATPAEFAEFLGGLDADGRTGEVDAGLLALALPRAPGLAADPKRRIAQIVKLFDWDRDRVVTLSDLRTIFAALDLNRDGTVGPAELRRARRLAR